MVCPQILRIHKLHFDLFLSVRGEGRRGEGGGSWRGRGWKEYEGVRGGMEGEGGGGGGWRGRGGGGGGWRVEGGREGKSFTWRVEGEGVKGRGGG